jgi:multicomponent Na+:H+ antiporter subunit C
MDYILGGYNYWMAIILMLTGLYAVIVSGNLVKKLIGLVIFQTSVLLIYISAGLVKGAHFPIYELNAHNVPLDGVVYVNPLPHVLMLTAIVVGVATLAVGLALAVRIKEAFGTIEEEELIVLELADTKRAQEELIIKKKPQKPAKRMTRTSKGGKR